MKKRIALSAVVLLLGVGGVVYTMRKSESHKEVHYHAGVVVYQNNQKVDFSDIKYMTISPCVDVGTEKPKEDEQNEKAHFHDNVGDVVHVEAEGGKWKDLFTNIKYPIDYANATGFVHGVKLENFLEQPIQPEESLVVFIGENDATFSAAAVTKEYIETQAQKSVGCGSD